MYDRQIGIFDTDLMSQAAIALIGAGRSVGNGRLLVAAGLRKLTAIDHGFVDVENVGQSEYGHSHVGLPKPAALETVLLDLAPDLIFTKHHRRAEDIQDLDQVLLAHDLIKIGIDDPAAMFSLADRAQRIGVDCIVAGTQGDNSQYFIAGIFPGGPTLKELLPSVWNELGNKEKVPAFFPSCLVNATTVNVHAARIAIGILHERKNSPLDVSEVGRVFLRHPLVIGLNGVHEASGSFMPARLVG